MIHVFTEIEYSDNIAAAKAKLTTGHDLYKLRKTINDVSGREMLISTLGDLLEKYKTDLYVVPDNLRHIIRTYDKDLCVIPVDSKDKHSMYHEWAIYLPTSVINNSFTVYYLRQKMI